MHRTNAPAMYRCAEALNLDMPHQRANIHSPPPCQRANAQALAYSHTRTQCAGVIEPRTLGIRLSYKTFRHYLAPEYTLFGPILMEINQS